MIAPAIASAACGIAVAFLVAAERRDDRRRRFLWKPLASAAFLAVPLAGGALGAGHDRALAAWILAGLALGAVGDVALMFEDDRGFLAGLGAFLAGHIAYVVALTRVTPVDRWGAGPMALVAPLVAVASLGVLAYLWRRLGSMKIPVIAYVAVITAMLIGGLAATVIDHGGAAAHARHLLTAGAALFYASDLAVAREKFVGRDPWNRTIGLPVYYAAQLGFGWALIAT